MFPPTLSLQGELPRWTQGPPQSCTFHPGTGVGAVEDGGEKSGKWNIFLGPQLILPLYARLQQGQ